MVVTIAADAAPPRNGDVSFTAPFTQAVMLTRPVSSCGDRTVYAATDARARSPSVSIAPAPTECASISTSSCFDVVDELTRLCQPEIAPQAIATNRIGQIGPTESTKSVLTAACWMGTFVIGEIRLAKRMRMIARKA